MTIIVHHDIILIITSFAFFFTYFKAYNLISKDTLYCTFSLDYVYRINELIFFGEILFDKIRYCPIKT